MKNRLLITCISTLLILAGCSKPTFSTNDTGSKDNEPTSETSSPSNSEDTNTEVTSNTSEDTNTGTDSNTDVNDDIPEGFVQKISAAGSYTLTREINGSILIDAGDDAIHANYGTAFENGLSGLGNITISGGDFTIYSTDDGLNAANKAGISPTINITGGVVDVTVYGGDVDGIDSNNTYTQTGGLVITKGGSGGMSAGLDTDGTGELLGN